MPSRTLNILTHGIGWGQEGKNMHSHPAQH